MDLAGEVPEQRSLVVVQRIDETRRRLERIGNLQKVAWIQPPAASRAFNPRPDVLGPADAAAGMPGDEGPSLRGLIEAAGHDHGLRRRLDSLR